MTNRIHDAFAQIEASEALKTSTRQFLQAERGRRSSRPASARHPAWKPALAAACAVLVLLVGIRGYSALRTPVSYVSIDVNPSVELALNRYDRVVAATAYNEDGEIVLDGVDIRGKLYTDAIDAIVESDAMRPYLTKDAALTFTVAAGDSIKENTLLAGIGSCPGCQKHGGQRYTADVSSLAAAHDSGLSFGKYAAYLVLSRYDSTITAKDCQNMSMAEIHHQISALEGGSAHAGSSSMNGNGTCSAAGSGHAESGLCHWDEDGN